MIYSGYAGSAAPEDQTKRNIAREILVDQSFGLSAQVLQEYIANALRKKSLGLSETNIDATLEMASHVPVLPITHGLILNSVRLRRRLQMSPWDATILAAAIELGCHTLYSEDFSHDRIYEGVRVINPFA